MQGAPNSTELDHTKDTMQPETSVSLNEAVHINISSDELVDEEQALPVEYHKLVFFFEKFRILQCIQRLLI